MSVIMNKYASTLTLSTIFLSTAIFAAPLNFQTYNPQTQAIFPVSSTLISGDKNAILVDAQFSVKDGENLVKMIQASGKNLSEIIITAGDPDFYFGLEPIVKAFPNAKVVATAEVVKHIEATKKDKLAYWGPILKENAPQNVIVPTVLSNHSLTLDGEKIEVKSAQSYAAYLWVPSNRTILGGVGVSSGIHLWTADTQTLQSRKDWLNTLSKMKQLHPSTVIPGHYLGDIPKGGQSIDFTAQYLKNYEKILKNQKYKDSSKVIAEVKKIYPTLNEESSLELSSKVHTGEMSWK